MITTKILPYQIAPRESSDEAKRRIARNERIRTAPPCIATMTIPSESLIQHIRIIDHLLTSLRRMFDHAMAIATYKEEGLDHPSAVRRGYTPAVVDDLECAIIYLEAHRMAVLHNPLLD